MSFISGTQDELLYSYAGASTNLATFTAEDNLQKTYPPVIIPPGFFKGAGGSLSKSLKVKARGQMGMTTGAPTFLWTLRLLTSTTWSAAGIILGQTAAVATGASAVVTAPWDLEADITLVTESIGGASTVKTMGEVKAASTLASPFMATIPSLAVSPSVATVDNSVQYYLFLSCACGASNALNLINTQMLKVYGEN